LPPLARAVESKIRVVDAFLDSHTSPLIAREEGSNIAIVDELDLLAALIILRVDYQVENSSTEVSLEDAGNMVVARLDVGKVSVDFEKTCDTERAVQAKLAGRGTGLEDVNLVEVEIEMLVAKRKQLVSECTVSVEKRVRLVAMLVGVTLFERRKYLPGFRCGTCEIYQRDSTRTLLHKDENNIMGTPSRSRDD